MRRNGFPVFCFFFLAICCLNSVQGQEQPFTIPSVRFSALGGNHAAVGDSFHAIFTNPASFVDIKGQFSAAELSFTTYGPVYELVDFIVSSSGSLDSLDFTGILGGKKKLSTGFDLAGPLSLGWVGKGLGLGLFSRVKADVVAGFTEVKPGFSGELILTGGYSFRIINRNSNYLDAGFLGKGFFRGMLNITTTILDIPSLIDDPLNRPFETYLGMGLDLGLKYSYGNVFSLAAVCFDVYSPVLVTPYNSVSDLIGFASPMDSSYSRVNRRLDFGIKFRLTNTVIDRYFTNLTFMADYHDLLDLFSDLPRNPLLNVGAGVEVKVLSALSFRFGMADALPAFGIGLNLSFLTFDFAIFGKELGNEPGLKSTYGLGVGILFRY